MLEVNQIYNGDCLNLIPQLPKVKAIITDPPYMINTKSDGMKKVSPWSDYCNAAYWYAAWMKAAKARLTNDGCLWTFLNWRSLVTFQKAACDINWPIESLLVWDKCCIGTGSVKGLRPSYEMIALFAMPDFQIENRSIADIQRFKWASFKPNGHPAEKPEELISFLISHSTQERDLVVDFFMGSGTTCVSCIKTNRQYIGIEENEYWFHQSALRIEAAQAQTTLY